MNTNQSFAYRCTIFRKNRFKETTEHFFFFLALICKTTDNSNRLRQFSYQSSTVYK